tara:strand:+ start:124651 stop:125481 length:831 start_codon:yes stop_codon:yes gene_type:complete
MKFQNEFLGELLGTFLLVLFGCGSVAATILFNAHQGLFQIALIWGIGVSLAIYLTRHLCCAHLNPAVTLAMVLAKRMSANRMPAYLSGQFSGAFLAGYALFFLFAPSIGRYEEQQGIIRGSIESVSTAKMFGEFYLVGYGSSWTSMLHAMGAEAFGTFLLVLMIFALTEGCNIGRPDNALAPVFIGLTVTAIICLIAPLTQAGLNPARDFGPRVVAYINGWGDAAFPDTTGGFFFVYILAPMVGAVLAGIFFIRILEPQMKRSTQPCDCTDENPTK